MIETFIALLLAHALADYILQTRWMVNHKSKAAPFLLHGLAVLITAGVALGRWDAWEIAALAAAHMVIDAIKVLGKFDGIGAHLVDQMAHVATLAAVAIYAPTLWENGIWAPFGTAIPHLFVLTAGLILVTRAGGFAIGIFLEPFPIDDDKSKFRNGGLLIGYFERALTFLFVLVGQPLGIGFLIAAKSILRFEHGRSDADLGEYIYIGTLASFGWALLISYGVVTLQDLLPPFPSLSD